MLIPTLNARLEEAESVRESMYKKNEALEARLESTVQALKFKINSRIADYEVKEKQINEEKDSLNTEVQATKAKLADLEKEVQVLRSKA